PSPRLRLSNPGSIVCFSLPPCGGGSGWGVVHEVSQLRWPSAAVLLRRLRRGAGQWPALPRVFSLREQLGLFQNDLRRMRRIDRDQAPDLPGTGTISARPRRWLSDLPEVSADVRLTPRDARGANRR